MRDFHPSFGKHVTPLAKMSDTLMEMRMDITSLLSQDVQTYQSCDVCAVFPPGPLLTKLAEVLSSIHFESLLILQLALHGVDPSNHRAKEEYTRVASLSQG